jgi:hypothetical protein
MTLLRKGLILAGLHCAMVLSLTGKLLYDRATYPRVWVKTAPYDPSLPIRGRYLSLQLSPEPGNPHAARISGERVLFFLPEHTLDFENRRFGANAAELWAEVTIPAKGPPRPIRLGLRKDGRIEPLETR